MLRTSAVLAAVLLLPGCPRRIEARPPERRVVRLLSAAAERETLSLTEQVTSLEADTDQERTPRVVARGESPLLPAEGVEVTLAGDEAGALGFTVDNFILLEVLSDDGRRVGRAAVGYLNGLSEGLERIDLLGPRTFTFEPNEVSLATLLPERGRFRVRATALDTGGVGRVSDVFLVLTPRKAAPVDELRER